MESPYDWVPLECFTLRVVHTEPPAIHRCQFRFFLPSQGRVLMSLLTARDKKAQRRIVEEHPLILHPVEKVYLILHPICFSFNHSLIFKVIPSHCRKHWKNQKSIFLIDMVPFFTQSSVLLILLNILFLIFILCIYVDK